MKQEKNEKKIYDKYETTMEKKEKRWKEEEKEEEYSRNIRNNDSRREINE